MLTFERIKELSRKRGLSLQEISKKAGLGINTIYKWKYYDPKGSDLAKVAKILRTSTDYLLGLIDNPKRESSDDDSFELTWKDLGQVYGGDSLVPDEFQTLVDSLVEGYFKTHPELRKKNDGEHWKCWKIWYFDFLANKLLPRTSNWSYLHKRIT